MKKIIFLALGEKAYRILDGLEGAFLSSIKLIVVGRDKYIADDYASQIITFARKNSIPCIERNESYEKWRAEEIYFFAVGWRWLIQENSNQLIVLHDSILPKNRGFAPLVSALINGDEEIGVTAIFGAKSYDEGDIIFQKKTSIAYPIQISTAIGIVAEMYIDIAHDIFSYISTGRSLPQTPQNDYGKTYAIWRDFDDYFINWNKSSDYIIRFINAVGSPYYGATTYLDGALVRILQAEQYQDVKIEDRESAIGKVIFINEGFPVVICGDGLIEVKKIEDKNGLTMLPLKKFRSRFSNRPS